MRFESWTLLGAIVFYLATCTMARAVTVDVKYQNPGTAAYTSLEVCSALPGAAPTCSTLPVSCAGGATCTARVDLPHGQSIVSARATAGGPWSVASNSLTRIVVDPAKCLADGVCRMDADADGRVSGTDFGALVAVFGRSWIAP